MLSTSRTPRSEHTPHTAGLEIKFPNHSKLFKKTDGLGVTNKPYLQPFLVPIPYDIFGNQNPNTFSLDVITNSLNQLKTKVLRY